METDSGRETIQRQAVIRDQRTKIAKVGGVFVCIARSLKRNARN